MKNERNNKKIKVLYVGNFSDPEYEGMMSIVNSLKSNINADVYTENVDEAKVDLINVHSSGFYESIKLWRRGGIKIYSLHANIIPLYFSRLLDYIQWIIFLRTKESKHQSISYHISKVAANLISNFTPLFVKRFFLQKMDAVVIPNMWLLRKLRLNNAHLIRHGIDVQKFINVKRQLHNDKIVVSYFGHPDPEKGILEVIDSFSRLQDTIFEKRMFFTERNRRLENLVRRKDDSIKVFGFVKNIVNEYNDSDIIVLPYRHALGGIATPLVLIESMACEKAIITSDLPHLKEICGDAVLYAKRCSVKNIVNLIKFLAKNSELRRKLGEKSRKRVVKYHDRKEMFEKYENLYRSITSSLRQRKNAS